MSEKEIYETIKSQLVYYDRAKIYKNKYDYFIDLTMSCDRQEAIDQCTYFINAAIEHWDIFGILAAYDLREYLKKQSR